MIDGMPWSVKGVEPDIRDDALVAAHSAGMTLGQWLNGVIRDSLVDLKATRAASARQGAFSSTPQEMARPTMQHYPGPQHYPYAPVPPMAPMMPPPYAMPQPAPYPQGWAQPMPQMAPQAPGFDPIEQRLRHYRGLTDTAVGAVPGQDQRVLSVIDAAVDAMQTTMRASEQKTAAALDALTSLIERSAKAQNQAEMRAAAQAAASHAAAASGQASPEGEQVARTLGVLVDRLSLLEKTLADIENRRSEDVNIQARRIEDRISEALDSLAVETRPRVAEAPATPVPPAAPAAPVAAAAPAPAPAAPVRPRMPVARTAGANAIADITARQRMLDAEDQPRGQGVAETAALDAIRRSIAALAEQVREQRAEPAPAADDDKLRSELRELQKAVQDLAPGKVIGSINESLKALSAKIEQSRQGGVREAQLAPIEKLLADMRVAMEAMREPRGLATMTTMLEQVSRRIDEIGARSIDPSQLSELQAQFADVRATLKEARQHQPANSFGDQIARLHAKLDSLAENPRDGRLVNLLAEAVEDIRGNMRRLDPDRILAQIDQRMSGLGQLESRLADLSERVSSAQAGPAPTQNLDAITRQIERMTRSITERAPAPDLSPIVDRIDAVRAQLAARPAAPDLSALESRIADIQSSLQQRPAQPDMKGLEQILRKLADRIETVRAPAANNASLDALQSQVLQLAERLDRSGTPVPALDGMERAISDLVSKVGSLKDTTVSAAERAVRDAIAQQPAGGGMDALAAEGMVLIKRDLTDMKSAQAESDSRSRETLQLVNTTLEKIVSRLSTLEAEFAKPRPAAAPVPVIQQAPSAAPVMPSVELAGNHSRVGPSLAKPVLAEQRQPVMQKEAPKVVQRTAPVINDGADDLPLEPGAGRNGAPIAGPGEAPGADPRSSFIAAARRAAQAAAAQTNAVLAEIDEKKGGKSAAAADGKGAGLKGFLAQRRKPLLLGLAALVFALGGLKVATTFMNGQEPTHTGSIAPVEPAPATSAAPANGRAAQLERRLAEAEKVVAQNTLPKIAQQHMAKDLGESDPTVVGSIGARPVESGARDATSGETAPALAPPAATAPTMDISALVKMSNFSGPDRLKQAAANGNLSAIYEIGSRMAEGRGTARDVKTGAVWLEFAANQGFAPAQYRLGSFNREGLGMPKDSKKAFGWFQKAAEQGHVLAMHNLAVLYAEGVTGQPDYAAAATWFRNAAEYGVKDSQFNIAILNVRGLGIANNMVDAYRWFAAAANQGDPDAGKKRDEVAARLSPDKLAEAKAAVESFRAKKPDARANDVSAPDGGWDQAQKATVSSAPAKKTRI
ncbi:MAG: hypothetical protein LCH61_04945 [Proteobacteria bacterium]|nr:hypothetical protein [Pseudomonadota bacterium]